MRHRHRDLLIGAHFQRGRLVHVHAGRLEIVLYRVENGPRRGAGKGRSQLQFPNLGIQVQTIVHLPHGERVLRESSSGENCVSYPL